MDHVQGDVAIGRGGAGAHHTAEIRHGSLNQPLRALFGLWIDPSRIGHTGAAGVHRGLGRRMVFGLDLGGNRLVGGGVHHGLGQFVALGQQRLGGSRIAALLLNLTAGVLSERLVCVHIVTQINAAVLGRHLRHSQI